MFARKLSGALAVILLASAMLPTASAHETFKVGNNFTVKVGWLNEPPVVDQANSITIEVTDASGKGVDGLTSSLHATISYGGSSKDLALDATENSGVYAAGLVPSVEGVYKVHVTGNIQGNDLGTSHTVSVQKVESSKDQAFPETYGSRADQAKMLLWIEIAAGLAFMLAIVSLIVGFMGLSAAKKATRAASTSAPPPARPAAAPPPRPPPPPMRR